MATVGLTRRSRLAHLVSIGTIDAGVLPIARHATARRSSCPARWTVAITSFPAIPTSSSAYTGRRTRCDRACIRSTAAVVLGSTAMDDARFDQWCPKLGCVGVSVEYRLAPETPFPGPLEDCYRG